MGNTSLRELLSDEHRRIDAGIKGCLDGASSLRSLPAALSLLRLHLYVEEEILFPPVAESGLAMPVFIMQNEHGQMWPLLAALSQACTAASPAAAMRDPANDLFRLLQIHNTKEEEVIYAAADRWAAEQPDRDLTAKIQAARMPHGWTCAMAPR